MKKKRGMDFHLVLAVFFVLFLLGFTFVSMAQAHYPVFEVEPTANTAPIPNGKPFKDAALNLDYWPTGWERTDFFGYPFQMLATLSDSELTDCFANIRGKGKLLVIAAWALKEHCSSAQACWDKAADQFKRFRNLGAKIKYLEIDEPLTTGNPISYDYAVQQTAEFIRLVRIDFPNIKVILQEAYPHQTASTLCSFYSDVNNKTIQLTGTGLEYAQIDHDWNAGGNLADLLVIQNSVRVNGMKFGVIFWAADNSSWYAGLMKQAEMYKKWWPKNLKPDMYAIINWTGAPAKIIPEQGGKSVYMRSIRDFANTYLPTPTSLYGLQANEFLLPNESRLSVDGRFKLIYQNDGNLVLYYGAKALWSSKTSGTSLGRAIMQNDGNFVVYDANNLPAWDSKTYGKPGSFLVMQSDGNLVIYQNINAVWASNTNFY